MYLDHVDASVEVGAGAVHLVQETHAGNLGIGIRGGLYI
jgi:hypothetical protein